MTGAIVVQVLAAAVCLLMAAFVVRRPAWALLLYASTASYAEGLGPREWFGQVVFFDPAMQGLLVVLLARATWVLAKRAFSAGSPSSRLGVACLAVIAWCLVGLVAGGYGPVSVLSNLPYLVLPYVLIWIAFVEPAQSRSLIQFFVIAQVLFALVLLLVPGLGFLRGDTYVQFADGRWADPGELRFSLPGSSTNKNQVANQYGQFHNPNALGFYAVVAMALAVTLWVASRRWVAPALLLVGAFLWVNTLTRGPFLAVVVMSVLLWLFVRDTATPARRLRTMRLLALASCALGLAAAALLGVLDFLLVSSDSVTVTGRLSGYQEAWDVIVAHPVFGFDAGYEWPEGARPHLAPLLFAAEHGVVAGLFITWLVFWVGGFGALRVLRDPRTPLADSVFAALGLAAVAGIALTNNFAAPVLCALLVGHLVLQSAAVRERAAATEKDVRANDRLRGLFRSRVQPGSRPRVRTDAT